MRKYIFSCFLIIFALTFMWGISASAAEKTYASDKIFGVAVIDDGADFSEEIKNLSASGFDAISLKTGEDGLNTEELKNVLSLTKNNMSVIIDCNEENIEDVFEVVKNYENVFLRARDMKAKDLTLWADKIKVIPSYDGNVIFSAISVYNAAEENRFYFCEFSSKNRYSVVFSQFFANRFGSTQGLMSFSEKDLSGQRNDSLHGWESALSLGYSAIETNNAKEFAKYISLLDESYLQLEKVYNEAQKTDLTPYSASSTKDFQKYLKKAESILNSDKPSSQLQINECIEKIELAYSDFELTDGEENKAITITPVKIFWICFAIALFVSSQVYLHRKTKKS